MTTGFDGVLLLERLDFLRVVRRQETSTTDGTVGRPFRIRSWQELADTFGGREFAGRVEERQVGRDGFRVEAPVDPRDTLERLELRGEDAPLGGRRPIERLHAGRVAREHQLLLGGNPGSESEDAVQPGEALRAIAREEIGQHLGVTVTPEDDTATLKADAEFAIIINLAVEAEHHAAGCICHRLRASGGKIENR